MPAPLSSTWTVAAAISLMLLATPAAAVAAPPDHAHASETGVAAAAGHGKDHADHGSARAEHAGNGRPEHAGPSHGESTHPSQNPPASTPSTGHDAPPLHRGSGSTTAPPSDHSGSGSAPDRSSPKAAPARVTICHHTSSATNPTVTITVAEAAAPAHERHGDTQGSCDSTPTTSPGDESSPTQDRSPSALDADGGGEIVAGSGASAGSASPLASRTLAGGSTLPFTGIAGVLLTVLGICGIAAGVGMRRTRRPAEGADGAPS